jgi:RNA polymerase sigma-70 factor (ECF subfamily)
MVIRKDDASDIRVDAVASTSPNACLPLSEKPSLKQLFETNVAFVWRTLGSKGVRAHDIEDAIQEVFLVAHRRMDDWDWSHVSARSWLYGIALKTAANQRRRDGREERAVLAEHATPVVTDPVSSIDRQRMITQVNAALEAMEPDRREVFTLFEIEKLTMKEIAAAIGCPLQTAYARLYAARRDLAQGLGEGSQS